MLANFDQQLRCCRLGGSGDREPRRDVACVVCAQKGWLNTRFPCFLWKTCPSKATRVQAAGLHEEQDSDESSAGECNENRRPSRTASKFCGEDGVYYFGDAHEIDKLLSVEAYHESLPTISLQELHASAVQHPRFPNMRWLLHSRRVPLKEDTRQPRVDVAADAADESLSSALWQRYEHVPQSKRLDIQAWLELDGAPFPEASESVSTGLLALVRELDSVLGLPFFLQAEAVRLSHLVQGDHCLM